MADADKDISQYDSGLALRDAHQRENHALRVTNANSSVPPKYSRYELEFNGDDSVTRACFFLGLHAEERHIDFEADVAGSLNNTYFTLYSENDESLYHVWYNVDGGGTDPAPTDSKGVEVQISSNDAANVVALATKLYLEHISEFKVTPVGTTCLKILNTRKGVTTNSVDNGTGFTIDTTQEGEETLLKVIQFPDDEKVRYLFNAGSGSFEVVPLTQDINREVPNDIFIVNSTIAGINSEGSVVLPTDLRRFTIRARTPNARLQFGFNAGDSSTNYRTVTRGETWNSDFLEIDASITLYIQGDKANTEVEIVVWRRI